MSDNHLTIAIGEMSLTTFLSKEPTLTPESLCEDLDLPISMWLFTAHSSAFRTK